MKKQFYILLLVIASLILVLFLMGGNQRDEFIHRKVSKNLSNHLSDQKIDLDNFESDFSVYTNPFAIEHDARFIKQVFVNGELVYWSDNIHVFQFEELKNEKEVFAFKNEYGIWLAQRRPVYSDHDLIEIYSVFNLQFNPPIINQYLENEINTEVFGTYQLLFEAEGKFSLKNGEEEIIKYSISEQSSSMLEWISISILLIIGILLVAFLKFFSSFNTATSRFKWLVVVVYSTVRIALFVFTSTRVNNIEIFNSLHFTWNFLNPTLGDTLLNAVWILLISLEFIPSIVNQLNQHHSHNRSLLIGASLLIVNLLMIEWLHQGVWQIAEHSQIELDISNNIQFSPLRIFTYLYLIILCAEVVVVVSASARIYFGLMNNSLSKYSLLIFIVLLFSVLFTHSVNYYLIFIVVWLIIGAGGFHRLANKFQYQTFILLVLIFTSSALIVSLSIYKHHEKDVLIAKEKFANQLLIRHDILGEYYLSSIIQNISEDRYIRSRMMSSLLDKDKIQEKIVRQYMTSYFKKYDINVMLFDEYGVSLLESTYSTLDSIAGLYAKELNQTDYEGIYFVEDPLGNVRNKYVCFIEIGAFGKNIGNVVLELTLKKYIPASVFPELLLESKYFLGGKQQYDYAVYKNGEILYKQGGFNFESKLNSKDFLKEVLYEEGLEIGGNHYLGVRTADNKILLIVSDTYSLSSILSNTSFVFLLQVLFTALVFLMIRLISPKTTFNLSTKIQLYLGLSFLLPMLVVSVALINTLNTSYKDEIDRNYEKESLNIAELLVDKSEAFEAGLINKDEYSNEVSGAASLIQSDLNVYDLDGRLIASSQPEIFRLNLISNLLNPQAYYQLKSRREQNIILEQRIGNLDFKTTYTAIRSYNDGRLLAILAMPYFDSKNHLHRQQVEVFSNLLVIFTAIFLLSLIGGNMIVGQLVKPLKRIGEKLRRTSLEETNQPIQYDAQDEIGSLVKEYNAMLVKLEESKDALAAVQKEIAWKEIARQVAHEIKNPLTPMRLKIQQMMRGFDSDSKSFKTCEVLINQVDSLNSIADSFSEFAKMPAPHNEPVELIALVNRTIDLYHSTDVKLDKVYEIDAVEVFLDAKIFSRILTNIILNAIQAQSENPKVTVKVSVTGDKVMLAIEDKGSGISEAQKEKIFTPYFSTKTTGSGIGLAVAKKGIENAGGNIWFESKEGDGTTFFISLPILKS